jgi:hypothetical protein
MAENFDYRGVERPRRIGCMSEFAWEGRREEGMVRKVEVVSSHGFQDALAYDPLN